MLLAREKRYVQILYAKQWLLEFYVTDKYY